MQSTIKLAFCPSFRGISGKGPFTQITNTALFLEAFAITFASHLAEGCNPDCCDGAHYVTLRAPELAYVSPGRGPIGNRTVKNSVTLWNEDDGPVVFALRLNQEPAVGGGAYVFPWQSEGKASVPPKFVDAYRGLDCDFVVERVIGHLTPLSIYNVTADVATETTPNEFVEFVHEMFESGRSRACVAELVKLRHYLDSISCFQTDSVEPQNVSDAAPEKINMESESV